MLKYLKKMSQFVILRMWYKPSTPSKVCVQYQSHSFALVLSHCLGGGVITL